MNSSSTEMHGQEPTRRELRQFGLTMGAAIGLVFGLLLPWLWDRPWPTIPWLLGAGFALAGLATPALLAPVFRLWMRFATVLGRVNSTIILTLAWCLLVVPTGIVYRLLAKDPMRRRADPSAESYRQPSERRSRDHFLRPF